MKLHLEIVNLLLKIIVLHLKTALYDLELQKPIAVLNRTQFGHFLIFDENRSNE